MTDTERWVNGVCERLMAGGQVRLYRDLYRDLRERLPCGEACRLICAGLHWTRVGHLPQGGVSAMHLLGDRARAIAALTRLARWAAVQEFGEAAGLYDGADRGM